jgi:hypothetical protein
MAHDIQCWKCGASLAHLALPFGRTERCKACDADLHVCKLCREFDPRCLQQCREQMVEEVRDKERANFCDHYKPMPGAWKGGSSAAADAAKSELEKLFGKR